MMPACPYCGDEEVEYHGVEDTGDSLVDEWECMNCGMWFEGNGIYYGDELIDGTDDDTKPTE